MTANRLSRELESRETTTRTKSWVRPELLPSPTPEPGYVYHWVRISTRGAADPTNVSSKLREGWEPVKAVDHPEIVLVGVESERFKDNIVMGGLMLCKAPVELVDERNEHYRAMAKSQMTSVNNNFMRENDPRMPLFNEQSTKVTFGKR
jgi:hypothetical protein